MSQSTPRLTLPYIQPAQAQKHVTHNEAIRALDLLVQMSFLDDALTSPPAAPAIGDCYIIAAGATGAWAGHDGEVAAYLDGQWQFTPPRTGWRGVVLSTGAFVIYNGSAWAPLSLSTLQNADLLGLGMTADAVNPFAAKLNAALWTALYTADGGTGDMMQTLNKQNSSSDAGWVLQEDFQTRALMGLFGDNTLRLSVSADGTNFNDGLRIDSATGIVEQPSLPRFKGFTNYDNFIGPVAWTAVNINDAEYNDQSMLNPATGLMTAPVDGTYLIGATLMYVKDIDQGSLRGRFVKNGTDQIKGSDGRMVGFHVTGQTAIWIQTPALLAAGDTVTLEAWGPVSYYLQANDTVFWAHKIG